MCVCMCVCVLFLPILLGKSLISPPHPPVNQFVLFWSVNSRPLNIQTTLKRPCASLQELTQRYHYRDNSVSTLHTLNADPKARDTYATNLTKITPLLSARSGISVYQRPSLFIFLFIHANLFSVVSSQDDFSLSLVFFFFLSFFRSFAL